MPDAPGPAPGPTVHILRPHHIGILTIFAILFNNAKAPDSTKLNLPHLFLLHVYRLLLSEVSEIVQPRTYREMMDELGAGPYCSTAGPSEFLRSIENIHNDLATPDQLSAFFASLPNLVMEKGDEEEPPILARRSIFGYFCRRCFISFLKLSAESVMKLQKGYLAWVSGSKEAEDRDVRLCNADISTYKTRVEKKEWAQPSAYAEFERGNANADHKVANESVRQFFEQTFNDQTDSGVRHHALLNLVRTHYLHAEFEAARKLLGEAITVARTSGDRIALNHCISMLHRMPESPETLRLPINEIQPDLNPLEILFDVRKLMDETYEQPLSAAFERVFQAIGVYDLYLETRPSIIRETDQWAQHAVQSTIWRSVGCGELASIEEDILAAFTETASDDNNRICSTLNKANDYARNGNYVIAIAMLLEPDVWRGLNISDYVVWSSTVWHILVMRATRRGQYRLYREQLLTKRGPGSWSPRYYLIDRTTMSSKLPPKIHEPLYDVIQLRQHTPGSPSSLEPLLSSLWYSEFLGRLDHYRTAMVLLGDLGLEYGMTKKSRRIIEDIMPQVINGSNVEQRALSCFVLGRCLLLLDGQDESNLEDALPFFLRSEADYLKLEMFRQAQDCQYLLSVIYHNIGRATDAELMARRHGETDKKQCALAGVAYDQGTQDILDLVSAVGTKLSER